MIQQSLAIKDAVYHIERDDQSFGNYGGVEKIELSRSQIKVRLDATGKENLECDGVNINFETDHETYELLIEKMILFFGGLPTVN